MTKPLPDELRVGPIRSADEARKWIRLLEQHNLSFHFDDPPETIYNYSDINNPVRLFLDEDVPLVRARVAELFDFDFCPFAFALALGWAGCERHEWETDENGQPQHPKRCSKCGYDSEIAEDAWR
jgi:hypothetical protein